MRERPFTNERKYCHACSGFDAITGSLYKLSPDNVAASLERNGTASMNPAGTQLHIVLVYSADPSWQKVGQLERDW